MSDKLPPEYAQDPYLKLRSDGGTPDDELCQCASVKAVLLRDAFGPNPLYCVRCNGEVAPERVGFDNWRIAEDIAQWRNLYRSLYYLWLDSGEYESWAVARLSDPSGAIHLKGMSCVRVLNHFVRAYYWWFVDNTTEEFVEPTYCPVCAQSLLKYQDGHVSVCEPCSLMM